jgi:hypothetical protein
MPQKLQIDSSSSNGGGAGGSSSLGGGGGGGGGGGIGWQRLCGEPAAASGCVDHAKALAGSELASVL